MIDHGAFAGFPHSQEEDKEENAKQMEKMHRTEQKNLFWTNVNRFDQLKQNERSFRHKFGRHFRL